MTFVQGTEVIGGAAAEGEAHGAGLRGKGRHLHLGWIFWLCVAWLAGLAIAAAAAPVLPLSNPLATDIANRLISPDTNFWLGTDQLGRDMLARVVYGARVSLTVAFSTALIAAAFGILLGLPAGYFRGRTEAILMGAADTGLAFPPIILILLVAAYAGAAGPQPHSRPQHPWDPHLYADRAGGDTYFRSARVRCRGSSPRRIAFAYNETGAAAECSASGRCGCRDRNVARHRD